MYWKRSNKKHNNDPEKMNRRMIKHLEVKNKTSCLLSKVIILVFRILRVGYEAQTNWVELTRHHV